MITNPQVGMRVRVQVDNVPSLQMFNGHLGTITSISNGMAYPLLITFNDGIVDLDEDNWGYFRLSEAMPLSPEDQARWEDQRRREAYADRYL